MKVVLKTSKGYEAEDWSDQELVAWFKDHTKDGIVEDEIFLFHDAKLRADDSRIQFVFSDATLDSDLERVDPMGWRLTNYRKNPVVLWAHDWMRPAIGKASGVKKNEKGLYGYVKFDDSGLDPFAAMIEAKVRSGIITKGSVGFQPKKIEIVEDEKDPTRLWHREQELIEFTIVNIPANINASVVEDARVAPENIECYTESEEERETSEPGKTSPAPESQTSSLDVFFKTQKSIQEMFI